MTAVDPLRALWLIDHVCFDGSLHGGGRLYWNLLPAFDPARVRVYPYFLRASPEVRRVFANAPVPVEILDKGKYDPTALTTLASLCRRHRIDVMHLYCYASSTFGRIVGSALGIPTVIHDFDTQIYFPYPLYLKTLDRVLAGGTGHAIAASPMCRDYMRDVRRVPADRISWLPHAIPEERFEAAAKADRARERVALGLPADAVLFCAITKLGPERGNEELLRAFARVAAERANAQLVLVYKPTIYHKVPESYAHLEDVRDPDRMRQAIVRQVEALGLTGRVRLVESLDDPEPWLVACDAVVAPFLNERFSSVYLLEAFAYGRGVVATELGEQREVIRDGENGLLVPPGDEQALAVAMTRLVDDPDLRARIGAEAARAAQRYRVSGVAAGLADLYGGLVVRARGPHAAFAAPAPGPPNVPGRPGETR